MPSSFSKLVEETRIRMLKIREHPNTAAAATKQCSSDIRNMNVALRRAKSIGEKQHITNLIALMAGHRAMMKGLKRVVGLGHELTESGKDNANNRIKWVDVQSSFARRMRTGAVINLNHKDPTAFLQDAQDLFCRRIKAMLKNETALKVNAVFCGLFLMKKGDAEIEDYKYLKTKNTPIFRDTKLNAWFKENINDDILTQLEEFQEKGSGWALTEIINITFNINKFTPQLGSSYIELPKTIKLKHACVNVRNDDDACFAWAVTSALHPVKDDKNSARTSSYPHYNTILNLKNITMPMSIKQIPRFERQNDLSVNVYILEKQKKDYKVVPTYLTKNKQERDVNQPKNKQDRHVNLLLIQDNYDEDGESLPKYHYIWIKNLSRLVSTQLSKHDGKKFFCDRCLHYFLSAYQLEVHTEDCIKLNDCPPRMPLPEDANLAFKNFKNKVKTPFIIYADLECLLKPPTNDTERKIQKAKTLQEHKPYSAAYFIKCSYDDSLNVYKSYRGEDAQAWFAREMKQFAENVETVFLCPLPMEPLTFIQDAEFQSVKHCHICEQPLFTDRVRDHCHLTGKYRGAAHNDCNINYKDGHTIPVVFHNLSGYDSHFIIKNLATDFEGRVELLPINKERYISFTKTVEDTKVKFRFIDSYRFMNMSLEKLAGNLMEYPNLKTQFLELGESKFNLLTRKGVFPYEYINSWSRLNETQLPSKADFYSALNDSDISDEDYAHACDVWNKFACRNLGEYSDLYLKTDVLLLTDVFEQFRASCLKTYGLDPAHYYTLPGYTWDCMFKYTGINLELLTDSNMALFIEKGIRGGLSQCSKRYAKANNKYDPQNYDSTKPSKFLIYDDINNQYGWAMSQFLPYGGFEWVDEGDVAGFNFNVPKDNPEGYILEVDLEYPETLHDSHSDLPFCPVHDTPRDSKQKKLLATVHNKEKYVIHYRNLLQALENGLKLTQIHRVLKFKQSDWLKSYIDLNTEKRTAATNDFEKDLYKLMNNAVYGKTMENVRKHSIVKLVTKWDGRYGAEALISKPNFNSATIFEENLTAIELNKTEVYFNKPIYVGMCVLDISKLAIYDFHYKYMRDRFGDKARVCYTDTDSLIYEVECNDLYEVIRDDAQSFYDTSDYAADNIYDIPRVNKKVLGMMKDENAGKVMSEFVGLRSKMYACRVEGKDTVRKAKGVKRHIVKNKITFNDYIECLNGGKETTVQQKMFKSVKHTVTTIQQTKIGLSPHDDKRYLIPGTHETLPWGHYSIMDSS